MTVDLNPLEDWLLGFDADSVALASTRVYWIPIQQCTR